MTNYPYQRPSGQPTTPQPPFSTQKQTYLPPSKQPYVPSSYNPRPSETPSYSNIGSSAFPPYSSTPRSSTSIQTSGYSGSGGGISTNYGYTSNFPPTSTPSGFSTTYDYSTQRPSPTYIEPSTYRQPSGYPSPNGYSYDQGGYPSSSGYPSSTPGGAFPPQTGGTTRPSRPPSGPTGQGTVFDCFLFSKLDRLYSMTKQSHEEIVIHILFVIVGSSGFGTTISGGVTEDDLKHPPHIHSLDVECSKTMMTINIEFNRAFDGVIYSKVNKEYDILDYSSLSLTLYTHPLYIRRDFIRIQNVDMSSKILGRRNIRSQSVWIPAVLNSSTISQVKLVRRILKMF